LVYYLKCAGCGKNRSITREGINVDWSHGVMSKMNSLHDIRCVPNVSKTIQFANKKKVFNMARSSNSSITFKAATTRVASESLIANKGDIVKTSKEIITADRSSSSSFSRIQTKSQLFPNHIIVVVIK
jgi:hypothetical protein